MDFLGRERLRMIKGLRVNREFIKKVEEAEL